MPAQPLSQSIDRLQQLRARVAGVNGLPASAAAPQSEALRAVDEVIGHITTTRRIAAAFVVQASAQLDLAAQAAKHNDLASVAAVLRGLRPYAVQANDEVRVAARSVSAGITQVATTIATLTTIANQLSSEQAGLGSQVSAFKREAKEIDDKKWYYLLLGPFGLIGLGIMTGLLVDAENKVRAALDAAQRTADHAAVVAAALEATRELGADLESTQARVNSVANAVEIVANDIAKDLENIADGQCAQNATMTQLFIASAQKFVESLRIDAA